LNEVESNIEETNRTNIIDKLEVNIALENYPELLQGNFNNVMENVNM